MPTKISWTDETWNVVHGCSPASVGCKNCYARRMARRLQGRCGYPSAPDYFKVTLRPDRLEQPLKWRKPRRIFVVSMGDLFHEDVPTQYIADVWTTMQIAHVQRGHIFQVLTKRPARMREFVSDFTQWESPSRETGQDVCPGIWLGVTAENQAMADERIPLLLQTPAAVRFVSCEPLLGEINLTAYLGIEWDNYYKKWVQSERGCISGKWWLDQAIAGSETGPGARPMNPDWARSLRDQCQAADVPYFFKQQIVDGKKIHTLDGREWQEFPGVTK